MSTMDSGQHGESIRSSFGPYAKTIYGTYGKEYKLWIDYFYDWFNATLERRARRYLVSIGIALSFYVLGLAVAMVFGFEILYLTSPGVYFVSIGVVWVMNSLRWLSQTYHVRTNMLRPCFPISDTEYHEIVSPYARRATRNGRIALGALCLAALISLYLGAIFFAPDQVRQIALVGFPPSLPSTWHMGDTLLPKFLLMCVAVTVGSFAIFSGAYIMFQTLPLYFRLASLPLIPLPNVIVELWTGVLDLYQRGALMWSFGLVLVELIYGVHFDILAVTFVIAVSLLGLLAFLQPRRALNQAFQRAKSETIERALDSYMSPGEGGRTVQDMTQLDSFVRFALANPRTALDAGQLVAVVGSQVIPLVPFIASAALNWLKFP